MKVWQLILAVASACVTFVLIALCTVSGPERSSGLPVNIGTGATLTYGVPGDSITPDEYDARQAAADKDVELIEIADIRDTEISTWVYDPNRLTDASIRLLCSSGRVCEVMGHQWRANSNDPHRWRAEPNDPGRLVYHQHPVGYERRACSVCGRTETRQLTEWQE